MVYYSFYLSHVRHVFLCTDIPKQVTSLTLIPAAENVFYELVSLCLTSGPGCIKPSLA